MEYVVLLASLAAATSANALSWAKGAKAVALTMGCVVMAGGVGLILGWGARLIIAVLALMSIGALWGTMAKRIRLVAWLPTLSGLVVASVFARVSKGLPYNLHDDLTAYLYLADRVNETGSLIDPFNARRLFTLGGATLLQSLFVGTGGLSLLHFSDVVVAPAFLAVIVTSVLTSTGARVSGRTLAMAVLAGAGVGVVVGVAAPRDNSSPYVWSTAVIVLSAVLVAQVVAERGSNATGVIPLSATVALAVVLRLSVALLLLVPLTLVLVVLMRRKQWKSVVSLSMTTTVLVAPWSLEAWLSGNALLYPVTRGVEDPNFAGFHSQLPGATATAIEAYVRFQPSLVAWGAILVAVAFGLAWMNRPWRLTTLALLLGGSASAMLLVSRLSLYQPWDHHRYLWPYYAAMPVVVVLGVAGSARRWSAVGLLVPVLLLPLVTAKGYPSQTGLGGFGTAFKAAMHATSFSTSVLADEAEVTSVYRRAQGAVPPGCRVFTGTDFPWAFDLKRNDIATWDLIGFSSPAPHLPLQGSARELWRYLIGQGFQYGIFVDPQASLSESGARAIPEQFQGLYNLGRFDSRQGWANPVRTWAPTYLDRLTLIDRSLREGHAGMRRVGPLWVVDLRAALSDGRDITPSC